MRGQRKRGLRENWHLDDGCERGEFPLRAESGRGEGEWERINVRESELGGERGGEGALSGCKCE